LALTWIAVCLIAGCSSSSGESTSGEEAVGSSTLLSDVSAELEVGESAMLQDVYAHCGLAFVDRVLNGTFWQADHQDAASIDWVPQGWRAYIDEFERIDLRASLLAADVLELTPDVDVEPVLFRPTQDPVECD
jgi:hypothetical protein